MNRILLACTALVATVAVPAVSRADAPKLNIGDAAPALVVDHWLKGQPIDQSKAPQALLVEFWATWCGPCIESIPHLNELQSEFGPRGLRVVGFTNEDPNNALDTVREFVEKRQDKINYTIAFQKEASTSQAYQDASGELGLPSAFLVDRKGRIAWIGHPMELESQLVARVLSGDYDLDLARRKRVINLEATDAAMMSQWDKFCESMRLLARLDPNDGQPYMGLLWAYSDILDDPQQAKVAAAKALACYSGKPQKLAELASKLARSEDPHGFNTLAQQAVDQAMAAAPDDPDVLLAQFEVLNARGRHDEAAASAGRAIGHMRGDGAALGRLAYRMASPESPSRCHDLALKAVDLAIAAEPDDVGHLQTKFRILWVCKQDQPAASAVGLYLVEKANDDPGMLNNFAWELLTEEDMSGKFNALALAAAQKCHKDSGGENWMFIDTLALASFENGHIDEAIAMEKKAIELCPEGHPGLADLQAALQRFETAKKDSP